MYMHVCDNMDKRINVFGVDCLHRGFHKHTVRTYLSNIKTFYRCMGDVVITHDVLIDFLDQLHKRNLAQSTVNGYYASLSAYCEYLVFVGDMSHNPVEPFRKRYLRFKRRYNGTNARQLISIEDMTALIAEPFKAGQQKIKQYLYTVPVRDKALMMMFAKTGLRKTEMMTLTIDDIDLETGSITVHPFRKRCNCRGFIDSETVQAMEEYLIWRADNVKPGYNDLWINHNGRKFKKDDCLSLITFYAGLLGVHDPCGELRDKFGCHCFRHFFTTFLRRAGMSREHRKWLRGDAPDGADDLYDHIDSGEVYADYLKCIPQIA